MAEEKEVVAVTVDPEKSLIVSDPTATKEQVRAALAEATTEHYKDGTTSSDAKPDPVIEAAKAVAADAIAKADEIVQKRFNLDAGKKSEIAAKFAGAMKESADVILTGAAQNLLNGGPDMQKLRRHVAALDKRGAVAAAIARQSAVGDALAKMQAEKDAIEEEFERLMRIGVTVVATAARLALGLPPMPLPPLA